MNVLCRVALLCGRALLLLVSLLVVSTASAMSENWLADGGFETFLEPRELRMHSATDRRDQSHNGGWRFDTEEVIEGARSLVIRGPLPYTWRLAREYPRNTDTVFSVYLRSAEPGVKVNVGLEIFPSDSYALSQRRLQSETVALGRQWQRVVIPMPGGIGSSRGHNKVHFIKAWVKPEGADEVWIDAAQLEVGRSSPRPYQPGGVARLPQPFLLNQRFSQNEALDAPKSAPEVLPEGKVSFTVSNYEGNALNEVIASGGIPFGAGEVFSDTQFYVTDAEGKPVPAQTTVLATRPLDGSVISLLTEIPVTLDAGESKAYSLHYGSAVPEPLAVAGVDLATEDAEAIYLNIGGVLKRFGKDAMAGVELVTPDGAQYRSQGVTPELVEIERNGPLHAIVRLRGKLADDAGKSFGLVWDLRFHSYAKSSALVLEASYEMQEPVESLPVASLAFSVFGWGGGALAGSEVRIEATDSMLSDSKSFTLELEDRKQDAVTITQLHQYFGQGRYDLVVTQGSDTFVYDDVRASGNFEFPDASVRVDDFAELNPLAISWSPGAITLYPQPAEHVAYLDLPFGISQTFRVILQPAAEGAHTQVLPTLPRVFADPLHVAASGVFGDFMPSAEALELYPLYEQRLQAFFDGFIRTSLRKDTSGAFDYGNVGDPAEWKNNETSLISAMIIQYLRSADPKLWVRAEEMARNFRDAAIIHSARDSKWVQAHGIGIANTGHLHVGHFWLTGLINHYLLTGDSRSYEAVRGAAPYLIARASNVYTGRERSRTLLYLASIYELTHAQRLREAFFTHLQNDFREDGAPRQMDGGNYYGGLAVFALEKACKVFGDDKDITDRLEAYRVHLLDSVTQRDALSAIGEDRDHFIFPAMALYARSTNDPVYLTAVADLLPVQGMSSYGMGANAVRASEYLKESHRLGVPLSDLTAVATAGVSQVSGRALRRDAALRLRVQPAAGQDAVDIYKLVNFRASAEQQKDDLLIYELADANSNEILAAGKMDGGGFKRERIAMPVAQAGDEWLLRVDSAGDAQFEVGADAEFFLAADQWMFFRYNSHGSGFLPFIVAPQAGEAVRVGLDWERVAPGSVAGIELLDTDGGRVSHVRWGLPLGIDWADDGAQMQAPAYLDISVPASAEGHPLQMLIDATKWMGWRIESGLQEPWLQIPGR